MKYKIVYNSPGRIRLRCGQNAFGKLQEKSLVDILLRIDGIISVKACSANGSILALYNGNALDAFLTGVSALKKSDIDENPLDEGQMIDDSFKKDLGRIIKKSLLMKLFVPSFLKLPLTIKRAVPYIKRGLSSLSRGNLNVDVLDAVSISAAIMNGSYSTASSVMTLLKLSSLLESYTRRKTKNTLSDSLAINIDKVWKVTGSHIERVPLKLIALGDIIRVQQGSMIPIDGAVSAGEAGVNESAMTGEALPQHKTEGMTVYAGTVVEEGSIDIRVSSMPDSSRVSKIIDMIEGSESLKSSVQTRAEKFADNLVLLSLATFIVTYLLSGNMTKALSVLMVDYSCAIKLSTPICVISAMREAANNEIMVKGGRFLENYAFADTIVFDKTGTLTVSCPHLAEIIPFDGHSEDEILRLSACLEEHFPHSVAKAIVRAAQEKGLEHTEEHAEVEYIVAHGIASKLHGQKVCIGSAHFIFDDEKVSVTDEHKDIIDALGRKYSMVYLAVGGRLTGILCIDDPIRHDAKRVIEKLKTEGFNNVLMITGDGEQTAQNVCSEIGIEKYYARVLPEDKLNIVNAVKKHHKVVMVGDGINDSPALAAADVSVAMKDASDIAREVADITLLSSELDGLIRLRELSESLFKRIYRNYRFIAGFNSTLIALGIMGVLSPSSSALLHNISTMGVCAASMKLFLKPAVKEEEQEQQGG